MFPTDRAYSQALDSVVENTRRLKKQLTVAKQLFTNGGNAHEIIDLLGVVHKAKADMTTRAEFLGMDNEALEGISADYNNLLFALNALLSWANDNIPSSGGYLLLYSLDAEFELVPRAFGAPALAGLVTKIDDILGAIA